MTENKRPRFLHVSFTITGRQESTRTLTKLREILGGTFDHKLLYCETEGDPEASSREVIYRIDAPVMMDDESWEEFFKKLLRVFNTTEELYPRFTGFQA